MTKALQLFGAWILFFLGFFMFLFFAAWALSSPEGALFFITACAFVGFGIIWLLSHV